MGPESSADELPLSKTEYVLERLRADIATGTYRPGDPLRQNDLAAAYGVSPTPVREALRLLVSGGLVEYNRHKGATVKSLSAAEIRDLYALRAAMEGLAVEIATDRLDAVAIKHLREINDDITAHRYEWQPARLSARNRDLHFGIYSASSPIISNHIKHIWNVTPPIAQIWGEKAHADRLVAEHVLILDALESGDGANARALMVQHITTSSQFRQSHAAC